MTKHFSFLQHSKKHSIHVPIADKLDTTQWLLFPLEILEMTATKPFLRPRGVLPRNNSLKITWKFRGLLRFKPGAAGWKAWTLPLCYTVLLQQLKQPFFLPSNRRSCMKYARNSPFFVTYDTFLLLHISSSWVKQIRLWDEHLPKGHTHRVRLVEWKKRVWSFSNWKMKND